MSFINIEIKARCPDPDFVRRTLKQRNAIFKGEDHQIDTYFNCRRGRLKLREGKTEHHLIHYNREDEAGPKQSIVTLYRPHPDSTLKEILIKSLDILAIVDKKREIYIIDNVKFHIDKVKGLGSFVEIEAIDSNGKIGKEKLKDQCEDFMELLGIQSADLIEWSYSDMILHLNSVD